MMRKCANCGRTIPAHPRKKMCWMDYEYAVLKEGKTLQIAVSTTCKGCGTKTVFATEVDFDSMEEVVMEDHSKKVRA